MSVERIRPSGTAGEKAMLVQWLEFQRATLALKCNGLSPDQLCERVVPPATMSLAGLVRHMAAVERWWFRMFLAEEDVPRLYRTDADWDADFNQVSPAAIEADFAIWREECDAARRITEGLPSLDITRVRRDEELSGRWVLIHMIEEYARHNGHADLLRQRLDGVTGV